jgi:predicted nucleic acid-binding protein
MYLIDSSAWIEYLRPKGSAKVKERVREVLDREGALSCGIVIVEVLREPWMKNRTIYFPIP